MKTKAYPWHELAVVGGPVDQKTNGKTEFPAYLSPTDESANAPMLKCRTPIPSKGKQRIWAVSYRKRSIETQIAVFERPLLYNRLDGKNVAGVPLGGGGLRGLAGDVAGDFNLPPQEHRWR